MAKINTCVQGDLCVEKYFDALSKYWREHDGVRKVRSCLQAGACCIETEDEIHEAHVVRFLMGLMMSAV